MRPKVKYVWVVVGSDNPCDIRRYAYSYEQAVSQLSHHKKYKRGYKAYGPGGGIWTLYRLVKVDKRGGK
jgi:hypothetical protein